MTQSDAQALAEQFYKDVARTGRLWSIKNNDGFPAIQTLSGDSAQPFWSSFNRATRIVETVPAFFGFEVVEISWAEFNENWAQRLNTNGILVGVNWSGPNATGYSFSPDDLARSVEQLAK